MRSQFTLKNVVFGLLVCFLPLLVYGIDRITYQFSELGIYIGWPGGDYVLRIVVRACVYMLLAVGLNIVCGFTGLLDLGYVCFYLIGGYTAGILMARLGVSYWIALPIAVFHGTLWGLLRGAPTLRLTGDYFAIVTFGFAELFFRIVKNEQWLVGAPDGQLRGIPSPSVFGLSLDQRWHNYYHILVLLGLVVFVSYRLQGSRVGRAWFAIREDEQAAECMGVNIGRYKSLAFAVSAAIGAMGGAFIAQFQVSISAPFFDFWESILILCMVVLGGMGSIRGAMLGAAILGSLGEVLREVLRLSYFEFLLFKPGDARYLIFGIILILLMRFRPGGLLFKKS